MSRAEPDASVGGTVAVATSGAAASRRSRRLERARPGRRRPPPGHVAARPQHPRTPRSGCSSRRASPGLTLRAIAAESGENSAMVQYYFGNKEGLVKAMIDSVFRDDQQDAAAAMSTVIRATTGCPGSSTACGPSASRARSASSSTSCPTRCATRGCGAAWRAPTTRTGRSSATGCAARTSRRRRSRRRWLGRRRAHDGGRRRPGHPGGHRRRLRHAHAPTPCSSSCCSARCRSCSSRGCRARSVTD